MKIFFFCICSVFIVACTSTQTAHPISQVPIYMPVPVILKELAIQVGKTKKAEIKASVGSPEKLIVSDNKETWYYTDLPFKVNVTYNDSTSVEYLRPKTFYPEFNQTGVMTGIYIGK